MSNILLIIGGLMLIGIIIHAYNMGWDAGHFARHDPEDAPPEVPRLWK